MERKITLGITRDMFDADGNLDIPGPGLELLDEMPEIQYRKFDQFLPEVTAEQIQGCDMVISVGARWSEHSLAGNDQLIALLYTGVGYDHIDVQGADQTQAFCFALRPMPSVVLWLAPL